MDKEKILQLLYDTYIRAEGKDIYVEKYILLSSAVEIVLENEGFIDRQEEGTE